ncbi:hypothetical protein B0T10DRAFT_495477 [Thelonectria olida]|uniref:Amidoligase enzyme-domain-containing protein n=1 Tax=Thelonectria olida TaxID=1576542 RepID=A0A9P8VW02_9HYPO|nr:hypothetical protein B0T10DRAFT_495477 [Thelonectria olida]
MRVPDSIVVGIEVEFLAAQHASDETEKAATDRRWACEPPSKQPVFGTSPAIDQAPFAWSEAWALQKGCETLARTGLRTACPFPTDWVLGNPINDKATSDAIVLDTDGKTLRVWNTAATDDTVETTDFWFLVKERHISLDLVKYPRSSPSSRFSFVGIELNSPMLSRPSEFARGLPTLRKGLTALRENMVLGLNANCGLHVHVSENGTLSLKTAQRVACLVLMLEDSLLMPISHPHRHTSTYSMRISTESVVVLAKDRAKMEDLCSDGPVQIKALGDMMDKLKGRKKVDKRILHAMMRIYKETNITHLGLALRKFDEGPVHTTTRCALVVTKHNSIEFRYPAATFDADYISGWVHLARHIFAMALTLSDKDFSKALCVVYEMVTRDEKVGWETVMTKGIGFREVVPEEWKKCMRGFGRDLDKQGILSRS